jgi:hypothetical protein
MENGKSKIKFERAYTLDHSYIQTQKYSTGFCSAAMPRYSQREHVRVLNNSLPAGEIIIMFPFVIPHHVSMLLFKIVVSLYASCSKSSYHCMLPHVHAM